MVVEFSLGIGANLVTDLIKYGGKRFLDSTRLGARLKDRLGLLDKTTEDEFRKILLETYMVYFSAYPNRQFQVFYDFFSSEEVSKCLFNHVFNFQPIDYHELESVLHSRMGSDWILFRILERDGLTTKRVIEDFIDCYSEAEKKSVGMGFLLTLREMRLSEQRIVEKTSAELKDTSDRIISSVVGNFSSHLMTLKAELKKIGVNTKDLPTLNSLGRDARQVEAALHELQLHLQPIIATAENMVVEARDTRSIPKRINDGVENLLHFARMLYYSTLNVMGYAEIAGYHFDLLDIESVLRNLIEVYKPLARKKNIKIQVSLRPKRQLLELSWPIELALNNLINNAVKYSFSGTPNEPRRISISGEQAGPFYKLAIRNLGLDIPPEEQELIFEDGYQTTSAKRLYRSGMGRGLYVAKVIIERHHGRISFSSEKDDGGYSTMFEIILPYRQPT